MQEENLLKRFWTFLQKDSFPSLIVVLIIAFILIRFLFFPILSLLTGTALPLVIVESCSMYHSERGLEGVFERSDLYEENGIFIDETGKWDFKEGFNKGDVIFVIGPEDIEVGDVIIFQGGVATPIIHRVISISEEDGEKIYSTKGDNNLGQLKPPMNPTDETRIHEDQVIGKALFRLPAIGWIKLIFFEAARPQNQRGFCS